MCPPGGDHKPFQFERGRFNTLFLETCLDCFGSVEVLKEVDGAEEQKSEVRFSVIILSLSSTDSERMQSNNDKTQHLVIQSQTVQIKQQSVIRPNQPCNSSPGSGSTRRDGDKQYWIHVS